MHPHTHSPLGLSPSACQPFPCQPGTIRLLIPSCISSSTPKNTSQNETYVRRICIYVRLLERFYSSSIVT